MRIEVPIEGPAFWDRRPAKALFERQRREPRSTDGIVTAFRDGQVTLRSRRRTQGFTNAIQEIGYQGIRRGDLVIHSMDGFAGAIGVSDSDGKSSPVVHCYRPEPDVDPRYFAYLLRDLARSGFITSLAKGIRERSTAFDAETFRALVLPFPPLAEQRAIADYLDTETTRIDALITKKRRLITLLEERWRREVDTVTAVGESRRVRHVTSLRTSGPRGWASQVADVGRPFIRSANLSRDSIKLQLLDLDRVDPPETSEARRSMTEAGDTLVGITGANTGWVGAVEGSAAGGFVSQHVAILRPMSIVPRWLTYSLFAPRSQDQLLGGQYGGTKTQLGLADLAELVIQVPPNVTQEERLRHLEADRKRQTELSGALAPQIDLLVERRQALITAAVTGDFAIPGAA